MSSGSVQNNTFLNELEINEIIEKLTDTNKSDTDIKSLSFESIKLEKLRSKLFHLHSYEIDSKVFNYFHHEKKKRNHQLTQYKIDRLLKDIKWKMQLFPKGYSQKFENHMSLFVNFNELTGRLEKYTPSPNDNLNINTSSPVDNNLETTFYDTYNNMGFNLLIKTPSDLADNYQNKTNDSVISDSNINSNEIFVKASFQINILDENGNKIDKCQSEKKLFELFGSWGYKEYIPNDTESNKHYLTDDCKKLTLNCKILLYYTLTTKDADYENFNFNHISQDIKINDVNSNTMNNMNMNSK